MRILLILAVLSLLLGRPVFGQNRKIDSLEMMLLQNAGKSGSRDLLAFQNAYFNLGYEYIDVDNDKGLLYSAKAFQLAKALGDSLKIVRSGRTTALAFRRHEQFDSALAILFQVLPVAKRNHYMSELEMILRGLAVSFIFKGSYDLALKYNLEELRLVEESGNLFEKYVVHSNIGLTYYKIGNLTRALEHFEKSVQLASSTNIRVLDMPVLFSNISLVHSQSGKLDDAHTALKQAEASCNESTGDLNFIHLHFAEGVYHKFRKQYDSAIACHKKSYVIAEKIGSRRHQVLNALSLSGIWLTREKNNNALPYLNDAQKLLATMSCNFEQAELCKQFMNYYRRQGNNIRLIEYQQKYIGVNNEMFSNAMMNNIVSIETDYLAEKKDEKIAAQQQDLSVREGIIERQQYVNGLVGVIAVLLSIVLFLLYRSYRRRKQANFLLEQKVNERTRELANTNAFLKHTLDEATNKVQKANTSLTHDMHRIISLTKLASTTADPKEYLMKVQAIAKECIEVRRTR